MVNHREPDPSTPIAFSIMTKQLFSDLNDLAAFVFDRTRRAVRTAIARVPNGTYRNTMEVDGYDDTVRLAVTLTVDDDRAASAGEDDLVLVALVVDDADSGGGYCSRRW